MDNYGRQIKKELLDMTSEHIDILTALWVKMFDKDKCKATHEKLFRHARDFYNDLVEESRESSLQMQDEISQVYAEANDLCHQLNKEVEFEDMPDDMPLVLKHQKLEQTIAHLRAEMEQRRSEICELLLQQEQLCEELGELPIPLLADPLPKAEELRAFREHLTQLQLKRSNCIDELYSLRSAIKEDMKALELVPMTDADNRLLNQHDYKLTPATFKALREMQKTYAEQVVELHERIDDMRKKIHVLWGRLKEEDEFVMRAVNEAQDYSQTTYDVLSAELKRCEELRRQNIKIYIDQLRKEIEIWWDKSLKSEQERKRFTYYYCDWYNEELLELHELELDDLKSYYNNNKEIFDLYARRSELWERMKALEAKANEPKRFNNRGGQLLKEERERKAITLNLPKIEQQIIDLVNAYGERNNTPFLIHGENLATRIDADWENHRQAKELRSSARKQSVGAGTSGKMLPPALPSTSTIGASATPRATRNQSHMFGTTLTTRKTPLQKPKQVSGAKSTGILQKRKYLGDNTNDGHHLQPPNAKRSLFKTSAGVKKVRVLATTMRRSSGLPRRSMGKARKIPEVHVEAATSDDKEYETDENAPSIPDTKPQQQHDETYDTFEKCIEPDYRSSLLPGTRSKRAQRRARNNNDIEAHCSEELRLASLPKPRRMTPRKKSPSRMQSSVLSEEYRLATLPHPRRMTPRKKSPSRMHSPILR